MTHEKYLPIKLRRDSLCHTVFCFANAQQAELSFYNYASGIDIEEVQATLGLTREEEVNDLLSTTSLRSVRDLLLDEAD